MPEEKELIKKRGSYKGRLTAFSTYLNTLKTSSLSPTDIVELEIRVGKIKSLYEHYDEVQLQLECIAESIDVQVSERNEFESSYYKLLAKAQEILNKYSTVNDNVSVASTSCKHKIVKLPTIQLPKFSGSYEHWLEFHDTFTSLINSNSEIDDINKFHYLRSSLEGTAATVIKSIEFSAKNYEVAWKLLCDRFDNKQLLIQKHISALLNLEAVTKESANNIKRLIDTVNKNLRSLESLGEPITYWDSLLISIITPKLDIKTFREWEEFKGRLNKNDKITLECFNTFLRNRADLLETIESARSSFNHGHINSPSSSTKHSHAIKHKTMVSVQDSSTASSIQSSKHCPMCKSCEHNLNTCPQFIALDNKSRLQLLPTLKVCFNCFATNHYANRCKKQGCKVCKRRHHTMIHITDFSSTQKPTVNSASLQTSESTINAPAAAGQVINAGSQSSNLTLAANVAHSSHGAGAREVLLSTALIKICGSNNHEYVARAVLDSGSTSCLITDNMFTKLNVPTTRINKSVLGINNVITRIQKMCDLRIKSLDEIYCNNIKCFVLPSITDKVPSSKINLSEINIPSDILLADPDFHSPAEVDLILGADVFWDILGCQKRYLGKGKPILYDSKFGWLVSGPVNSSYIAHSFNQIKCNFAQNKSDYSSNNDDIQNQLMRFWQLEEICPKNHYSKEESLCEEHFVKNTFRLGDGRFCVKLPLKRDPKVLGNSYLRAKNCFLTLERRNKAQPYLGKMYSDFMLEYKLLGHMTECSKVRPDAHYIPHHGVLRESSTTTKLRAVFNASCPTTSGVSLNDILMVGPQVQDDLLSILIRFRQHRYVITADVAKMYRQVALHPDDRHLLQILWRFNPDEPLVSYQLGTVTYGTACASFLATRCLKQLGLECPDPKIAEIITHDFLVDDLLTGGSEIQEVLEIREKVTNILASACMPLRKWKSNDIRLSNVHESPLDLNINTTEPSKTLGLGWLTESDQLYFSIGAISNCDSKRNILSTIAQIFDPLGLLAPCVIRMKLILQRLWLEKVTWDDKLSPEVSKLWADVVSSLQFLNKIQVPRHVICHNYQYVDMHIFTDASERAYGSCLYLRSVSESGNCLVRLLLAKSRVAPVKPTTVPRLELCGALVGVRLYEKAISSLRLEIRAVTFWTDSTIVLGWLKMLPSKLQPFVRNRIAEIVEKTSNHTWRHIPTDINPADYITRGVDFKAIRTLDSWWLGPEFLQLEPSQWPSSVVKEELLPETRQISLKANVCDTSLSRLINFERFSNLIRLNRAVAYVLRFINVRCKRNPISATYLTHNELKHSLNIIIRISQAESFPEYHLLLKNQELPKKSPLLKLSVFLDEDKIMRVGGRLENSNYSYDKKHPIILQSTHRFTKLLFLHKHKTLMHAGPQLLLASIRETYWPIGGRNLAKKCCHQCIRCCRLKAQVIAPLMGNLPEKRVSPGGYPFNCVGVDYAGPLAAVSRQGRGSRVIKVYIAIFICFATKAVHLELVGDLTSNNYMLALRRFISRRGKPQDIYSDNGTSFVGAYNELSKFLKNNSNSLGESLANEGIQFHFIPGYTPHFGGLWEAGLKSTKFHVVRVLGNCHLTYEELNTTLIQIEAILNSRPLTPLSTDPDDLTHLTPGHFLIGRSLTALPEPSYGDCSYNILTRFQRIGQLRHHFWLRWSKEYVTELQQRTKWRLNNYSLKLNSLVVVKEDNLPPMKWRLGRVIAVHPGADGISRVADIRTSSSVIRRAFNRICPLPEVSP